MLLARALCVGWAEVVIRWGGDSRSGIAQLTSVLEVDFARPISPVHRYSLGSVITSK